MTARLRGPSPAHPTIALNCRFLEKETRGIGRYAQGLAAALRRSRPGDVECLVSGLVAPHLEGAARLLNARRVTPLTGPVWEQTTLPAHLLTHGRPLLVNFVNTAPLLYRRQVTVVYDLAYRRHPEMYSAAFLALYRAVIPRVVRRARIVTISEFVKSELVAMGAPEDRVAVVPSFVAPELLALAAAEPPPSGEGDRYALIVGSLNARKNLRAALEAIRAAAVSGLRVVVVGESATVFRALELDGAVDERVSFAGAVNDAELVRLYTGAHFLLFPSLYEGFGMPPIEAMACGCPVIASSAASMPEVCGDAAYYCDPTSVADMARAIARVAGDAELRERLRARGRARAGRFTLERSAALFERTIEHALAAPSAGPSVMAQGVR
ncbi:MAG TPA: glycosyltransferase family 1 protein [Gemmatimonadaceae bacterium]|nr:glycosyltransferase family 1 protein [Gemmatimonadaceae bacterium]